MTSSTPKKLCSGLCVVAVEAESASLLVDVRASTIAINVTCFWRSRGSNTLLDQAVYQGLNLSLFNLKS